MAVTQKQIAEAAGVSRGTVDRVINGRGHVRPDVEARILRIAEEMKYRPNPVGRALVKSGKQTKIGVICQFSETPFMELVLEGVRNAQMELALLGTEVVVQRIDSYSPELVLKAIDDLLDCGVEGIALTPGNSSRIQEKIRSLSGEGFPIVTFNTDIEGAERLCYVGLENSRAGRICGGIMASSLRREGIVLPISGYENHQAHRARLEAFCQVVKEEYPQMTLLPVKLCQDRNDLAREIVHDALRRYPDLRGIYLSGNGQQGVCRALREEGKEGEVCIIVYDLTQMNKTELSRGSIDFLIDQDAFTQGYRPSMLLYDYLILKKKPEREYYYTDIRILNRFSL